MWPLHCVSCGEADLSLFACPRLRPLRPGTRWVCSNDVIALEHTERRNDAGLLPLQLSNHAHLTNCLSACISEPATCHFSLTAHHSHLIFAITAQHTTPTTHLHPHHHHHQSSWTAPRATTASPLPPRPRPTGRRASLPRARAPTRCPTRSRPTRRASRYDAVPPSPLECLC